ncbi:MAG: site-specific DNA-methyltransferase, partial [Sinobacteraceae bacterium]|nr:site-specific DNA-methyltransferase [Nevskiaceae bacterium]
MDQSIGEAADSLADEHCAQQPESSHDDYRQRLMARTKKTATKRPIESYEHKGKERANNPPVGLVTPETDPDAGKKKAYAYDPHLDPRLEWAGKAEHTSFEVPTVSLHVHERIDPRTIIEAVKRRNGGGTPVQGLLFEELREEPLRQAVEFYQHAHGWSNRMVAGDSLLVMNSLLEKEGLAGKVQMVYLDPPYGIRYGSNFQPFVNKRDVKDRKDEDLTAEPEQIRAFRDTWELGIHSYLSYLRDRLLLARKLLTESGSIFVQISDENVHHVRELMDEVFGVQNFVCIILFKKTGGLHANRLASVGDFIVWYAKDAGQLKTRRLYLPKQAGQSGGTQFRFVLDENGQVKGVPAEGLPKYDPSDLVSHDNLTSQGNKVIEYEYKGRRFKSNFKPPAASLDRLAAAGRLTVVGNTLRYVRRLSDFPYFEINQLWDDLSISGFADKK